MTGEVFENFMLVRDDDGPFIVAVRNRTVIAEEKWDITVLSEEQAKMVYQYLKDYLNH